MRKLQNVNCPGVPVYLPELDEGNAFPKYLYGTTSQEGETMTWLHAHQCPVPSHLPVNITEPACSSDAASVSATAAPNKSAYCYARLTEECYMSPDTTCCNDDVHLDQGGIPSEQLGFNLIETNDIRNGYDISYEGTMKLCKMMFNLVKSQKDGIEHLQDRLYKVYEEILLEVGAGTHVNNSSQQNSNIVSLPVVRGMRKSCRVKSAGL
jgi:hypothetical protein